MAPRTQVLAMVTFLGVVVPNSVAQTVFWAEGEHYYAQTGSVGPDCPPFGSGGECLGSNWGAAKGHHVVYRFELPADLSAAAVSFRYARKLPEEAAFEIAVDGKPLATRAVFPTTSGWGHVSDAEWRYVTVPLGGLSEGVHRLELVSLADKNNVNIDGFLLASPLLPSPAAAAEITSLPKLKVFRRDRGVFMDRNLTLDTFAPVEDDPYYPAEEAEERETLQLPRLVGWEGEHAILRQPKSREKRALSVGQSAWGWEVIAKLDSPECVVLERNFNRWGLFAYVSEYETVATIRKSVGKLEALVKPSRKYPENYVSQVMASQEDVLGKKLLALGDPSYQSVAGYLPDITGYTFLGIPERVDKIAVEPDGVMGVLGGYGPKRIEHPVFDPQSHVRGLSASQVHRGLLGGYRPAIDYGFFDEEKGQGWEQMALCAAVGGEEKPGKLLVALKVTGPWQFFSLEPVEPLPNGARFFKALLNLHTHWQRFFEDGVKVRLPEPRLEDACRAAIARARITYNGLRPKYGVGVYANPVHDGFPPTTLAMVAACLEWGLFDVARDCLDYYLKSFVKPDGTFDYYGPAVSEYGMMLERAVRFVRYTGDKEWLDRNFEPLKRIADLLLRLRRESLQKTAEGALTRGLLFGSPEADTHKEVNYYYSGSVWAWRGLLGFGRLLGEQENESRKALGHELLSECPPLRQDILRSMERSLLEGHPKFLPPYPGIEKPFPTMTCDTLASYTNYRYWLEMLSADSLPEPLAHALLDYRREKGGEFFGTTRFMDILDDWPLANHAWGLLAWDQVEHYLLTYYGHLAHHQMRGTFNAYEGVHIRDVDCRRYAADYCIPAQLTIPLMTKWMLVFEERDQDRLWLCKAAPRRWFAAGESFSVHEAPTRWGKVSFEVKCAATRIVVHINAPPQSPAEVVLRLRRPDGKAPRRALVNGKESKEFDPKREAFVLRKPRGKVAVRADY